MDDFVRKDQYFVTDWLVRQGFEKIVDVFKGMFPRFHTFSHCLSSYNLRNHCLYIEAWSGNSTWLCILHSKRMQRYPGRGAFALFFHPHPREFAIQDKKSANARGLARGREGMGAAGIDWCIIPPIRAEKSISRKRPKTLQTFQLKHLKNIHSWLSNRQDNIDLVLKFWNHIKVIRKLTLAIVTCPTSLIPIQNHYAFHEYFANKGQIKASLSLEIVKKTSRDHMQRLKNVCRPKKVCDRNAASQYVAHTNYSEIWPDFWEFWLPFPFSLFMYCYTKSQSNWKLKFHYPRVSPGDQPLTKSRRNSGLEIENNSF